MKKILLCSLLTLVLCNYVSASTACIIIKENNKTLLQEGECQKRYSPASSFKIPLSLIGYDSSLLAEENSPTWGYKKSYDAFLNICKSPHNPKTWMRDSCVWYSQVLTKKLGIKKFKDYVAKFDYGNQDLTGDKDKNNGLTNAWLSSSLLISPQEQTVFIQKFIDHKLGVSEKSYEMTKKILFREELGGGWKLYGKTGNGSQTNNLQHGWFVGWIEKDKRKIVFASHLVDDKQEDVFASFRARYEANNRLWKVIEEFGSKIGH